MKRTMFLLIVGVITFSFMLSSCSDSDELDDCLGSCGDLEGFPLDSPCGEDGWLYHNQCDMDCHGIAPAVDRWLCATSLSSECDEAHVGLARHYLTKCGTFEIEWCSEEVSWETTGQENCMQGVIFDCFDDCPLCLEDEAEFICGKKGVRYCNECVMNCFEDEAAGDDSACGEDVKVAGFCESGTDTYASREKKWDDYGCNVCECINDIWQCSFYGCPGTVEEG